MSWEIEQEMFCLPRGPALAYSSLFSPDRLWHLRVLGAAVYPVLRLWYHTPIVIAYSHCDTGVGASLFYDIHGLCM
jgi:hypothetical protein